MAKKTKKVKTKFAPTTLKYKGKKTTTEDVEVDVKFTLEKIGNLIYILMIVEGAETIIGYIDGENFHFYPQCEYLDDIILDELNPNN